MYPDTIIGDRLILNDNLYQKFFTNNKNYKFKDIQNNYLIF